MAQLLLAVIAHLTPDYALCNPSGVTREISDAIYAASKTYQINPALLAAVIQKESGGYAQALRWESGFFAKYIKDKSDSQLQGHLPKTISIATERVGRAMSWGLMQVMGQTARELGFGGESLGELFDPKTNINLGAKKLARCLDKNTSQESALLAYNGGKNKRYAMDVLKILDSGEAQYLLMPT